MKLSPLLGILGCFGAVSAQYFSAGWSPGQPVQHETASDSSPDGSQPQSSTASTFDWSSILKSGPVMSILTRLGFNATEWRDGVKAISLWDDRIPLVTDENFNELIVNEEMTPEEEAKRMWFLVITGAATKSEGLSKLLDDVYDAAYNAAELEGGIEGVRWGRIDYLNVTFLTTKWAIWQAPHLVFLTDRGKTLRFLRGGRVRLDADAMKDYIKAGHWKTLEPWSSAYAPGGEREWLMDKFAFALTKAYNAIVKVPSWLLFILSGAIGTFFIGLLHRSSKSAEPTNKTAPPNRRATEPMKPPPSPAAVPTPASPGPAQNTRRTSARQRKAAKK